jgi:hypothetical protein
MRQGAAAMKNAWKSFIQLMQSPRCHITYPQQNVTQLAELVLSNNGLLPILFEAHNNNRQS